MTFKKIVHCPLSIVHLSPRLAKAFFLFTFTFLLLGFAQISAQQLTVKEIMKEPSIAGSRVSGERLSPDGKWVVFLWNAEGLPAEDLYIVSTAGGAPTKLLSPSDLITKKTTEAEKPDPLEYGVIVEDDFVKARKNGFGNLRWSPDSTKILFTQSGDIYVYDRIKASRIDDSADQRTKKTSSLAEAVIKLTASVSTLEAELEKNKIAEPALLKRITQTTERFENEFKNGKSTEFSFKSMEDQFKSLLALDDTYPRLKTNRRYSKSLDECAGQLNRVKAARIDYELVLEQAETTPKRITKTESLEFSADFLDNERILFQQSGNLFSIDTKNGTLTQISKEASPAKNISVFGASASKDGSMMAYMASDGSSQRPLFVPNYLPYYTAAPSVRRGWSKSKIYTISTNGSADEADEIKLPEQEGEAYIAGVEWMADNKTLIVDRVDKTHKRRQLFAVSFTDGKAGTFLIFEETDDKWIGGPANILIPHPSNSGLLVFSSEKETGYEHLFTAKLDPAKFADGKSNAVVTRITEGNWEINWAKWFSDDAVLFLSTKEGASERTFQYFRIDESGNATIPETTKGMRNSPQVENGTLVFGASDWKTPEDLYSLPNLCLECRDIKRPANLTNTVPATFLARKWNEPKITGYKARDGKMVPAKIYVPAGFDKKKKYPMVVFVHGAGYLQNVINGWNNYYREFMFNEMLTQKGYVVLDIDYRGSAGYGRDWRTDVYDFLGGKDYEDHIDGIDFMAREYNIDTKRIGVYGGSYGGFMAAMMIMRSPDKVQAAAALRPVMDWKNYYAANPFYTSQRLGDPKTNPEAYKRSSPIAYAKDLSGKLLILHGMLDDNVHVQDSLQLIEQLMRYDKTEHFELMLYPAEKHSFERPSSWEDEYERILALFEAELKTAN